MGEITGTRTVSNRGASRAEGIRLNLYADVRQAGADPSGFLDELAYAVEQELWTELLDADEHPLTFQGFICSPFPIGIGSSLEVVRKLSQLPHRYEGDSAEKAHEMDAMRAKVRELVEGKQPNVNTNGANQHDGGFDMSNPRPSGKGGNSRKYRIGVLKRDGHRELADMVIKGEMSAASAWAEAYGKPTALDTLRKAWAKASPEERRAFLAELGE